MHKLIPNKKQQNDKPIQIICNGQKNIYHVRTNLSQLNKTLKKRKKPSTNKFQDEQ